MPQLSTKLIRQRGFTLVETVVAMGITATSLICFHVAEQQASRLARAGRSVASASEMLQERIETFRYAPQWSNITTPAGIAALVASDPSIAANFTYVSETFTVQAYPGGSPLVVTRLAGGGLSNNGMDLSSSRCVKLTITTKWIAPGDLSRTRQVSTIITRGGI
jgi:prepilin-type N-terminal cleavage/methylation domain-containing protein